MIYQIIEKSIADGSCGMPHILTNSLWLPDKASGLRYIEASERRCLEEMNEDYSIRRTSCALYNERSELSKSWSLVREEDSDSENAIKEYR